MTSAVPIVAAIMGIIEVFQRALEEESNDADTNREWSMDGDVIVGTQARDSRICPQLDDPGC